MRVFEATRAYGLFIFSLAVLFWNLTFILPTIWMAQAHEELALPFYFAHSFTCHQLDHRSLCLYPQNGYAVGSCTPQDENDFAHRDIIIPNPVLGDGYKFAVCARDIGIYVAMVLGTIAWVVHSRKNLASQKWPKARWLILAMIPIALDGGTQMLGLRESTNELRLITGAIAGFATVFYLIPAFNQIFNPLVEDIAKMLAKK